MKMFAILFAAGAAVAGAAVAETVYKYQRPDGTVIYSDAPVHGARLIGRFELVPLAAETAQQAAGAAAQGEGAASNKPSGTMSAEERLRALDRVEAEIKAADAALKEAQQRQREGVEPLPGERLGNVVRNGRHTSRLSPEYFARQQALAAEVEAARQRLERLYEQRNDLRD